MLDDIVVDVGYCFQEYFTECLVSCMVGVIMVKHKELPAVGLVYLFSVVPGVII